MEPNTPNAQTAPPTLPWSNLTSDQLRSGKLSQILEAPAPTDMSNIPPLIRAWGRSQGYVVTLQCSHQDMVATMQPHGFVVLFASMLPDAIHEDLIADAIMAGYQIVHDRFIMGDACLAVITEARRQALADKALYDFVLQDTGSLDAARAHVEDGRNGRQWPGVAPRVEIPPNVAPAVSHNVVRGVDTDSDSNAAAADPRQALRDQTAGVPQEVLAPGVRPQNVGNQAQNQAVRRR